MTVAKEYDTHFVGFKVEGDTLHTARKDHQLFRCDTRQSADTGNATPYLEQSAGFTQM